MDALVKPASAVPSDADVSAPGRLDRIAELVGCPVETFTGGADCEIVGAAELLQLWLSIADADRRGEVLALARQLAQG